MNQTWVIVNVDDMACVYEEPSFVDAIYHYMKDIGCYSDIMAKAMKGLETTEEWIKFFNKICEYEEDEIKAIYLVKEKYEV